MVGRCITKRASAPLTIAGFPKSKNARKNGAMHQEFALSEYRTFTSESVSEGHPDKLCDQISDAVLDAALASDPQARVACETLIKSNTVIIAGEVTTRTNLDYENIARDVLQAVGYTKEFGIDCDACEVRVLVNEQSSDIKRGVDEDDTAAKEQGAGDQGMMFGYASNETPELMPAPILYSHRLMRKHAEARRDGMDFLGPDAKCQLTVAYEEGQPTEIKTIVFSTQHDEDVDTQYVETQVIEEIIKPVLAERFDIDDAVIHINPCGPWTLGGPATDCGLTGRKIIVDSYGGMARHGGGAFSGKDPSKVDRSAAYAARYVAKNVVAAGLAARCEVQLSYAIGQAQPVDVVVNTFGTAADGIDDDTIGELVAKRFDLSAGGIVEMLGLKKPIYRRTATFGHFGHSAETYSWENTDRAELLKADAFAT